MIPIPHAIGAFFAKWGVLIAGCAVALLATFYAGKLHERSGWEARRAESFQTARNVERDANDISNKAERAALAAEKIQREKADAEIIELRTQLAKQPRCPVPRNVVRLLDGTRVPATAGAAAEPGRAAEDVARNTGDADRAAGSAAVRPLPQPSPASAGVSETVDASAVIENCAHNRLMVCEPNAVQLEAIQRFYTDLRHRFNRQ